MVSQSKISRILGRMGHLGKLNILITWDIIKLSFFPCQLSLLKACMDCFAFCFSRIPQVKWFSIRVTFQSYYLTQKSTYLNAFAFQPVELSAERKLNRKGENTNHFCFMNCDKSIFDYSLGEIYLIKVYRDSIGYLLCKSSMYLLLIFIQNG